MIAGWAWEGTAPGAGGCGVSDEEDRARQAAEAWLTAHPGAVAVLGTARVSASADAAGCRHDDPVRMVGQGRAGEAVTAAAGRRITWARIPVQRQAPATGTG